VLVTSHYFSAARMLRLVVIVADRLPMVVEERFFELSEVLPAMAYALEGPVHEGRSPEI